MQPGFPRKQRHLYYAGLLLAAVITSSSLFLHFHGSSFPLKSSPTGWEARPVGVNPPETPTITYAASSNLPFSPMPADVIPLTDSEPSPSILIPTAKPAPNLTATASPDSGTVVPTLEGFVQSVTGGAPDAIKGVYTAHVLALRVVPQPEGNPNYVSVQPGTATQFGAAALFGVVGLLSHNFLAGRDFFGLRRGDRLTIIYGDGSLKSFRVSEIADFQRLTQNSLTSDFQDLDGGQVETSNQVFARFFEGASHLTLETCIRRGSTWDWGVRFIVAQPSS